MRTPDNVDFYTEESVITDPHPYFDRLRDTCPVWREPHHGTVIVTRHADAVAVLRNHRDFSSCNAAAGSFSGLPFEVAGEDIGELIEEHRSQFPMGEHLVMLDPPRHALQRHLLQRLFTAKRLEDVEEYVRHLADRLLTRFLDRGACEVIEEYTKPFTLLVITHLLGVPEEDHAGLLMGLGVQAVGVVDEGRRLSGNPLESLDATFTSYVEQRRREPRDDVLTEIATARFADGTLPDIGDLVRLTTLLFVAGHYTTSDFIASCLRGIAEDPGLQHELRQDMARVPQFVEEALRTEGPVTGVFRLARRATVLGGVTIPAGTTLFVPLAAANRDPQEFAEPGRFRPGRCNVRKHLAFGRGIHTCIGATLARSETRITIERLLARTATFGISTAKHGPPGGRRYFRDPSFVLASLKALHLECAGKPVETAKGPVAGSVTRTVPPDCWPGGRA